MFFFITGLLLLIAGVVLFFVKWTSRTNAGDSYRPNYIENTHHLNRLIPVGVLALAVVFIAFSCLTQVESKNVGVVKTFGAVSDRNLGAGLSAKLPWQEVVEIDGAVQTDEYKGDEECIEALIGDGGQACIWLTNRWRISPERADRVYQDYRSDDPTADFRKAVVSTELKSVVQDVAATYNPVAAFQVVEGEQPSAQTVSFTPDYKGMSLAIQKEMEARLGDEPLADIVKITVSYVRLPKSTQQRINDFTKEVGNTRIAAQKKETAANEAAANNVLRASLKDEPGILQSKCLDLAAEAIESGYEFNAGWSCMGGSNVGVLAPSSR